MNALSTATIDSISLRKTHFVLGDNKTNYITTNHELNKNVEPKGRPVTALSNAVKSDLRKSHFTLGNFQPNYVPSSKAEFTNKGVMTNPQEAYDKNSKNLRKHSHILGDNPISYKSEMQSRFVNQTAGAKAQQPVSTAELQKSHYVFGSSDDPWKTTSQLSFGAKDAPAPNQQLKNVTKTNFIFGQDAPNMKSVFSETFIPHKVCNNNTLLKELSKDLRQHHFKIGGDDPSMVSVSHLDYAPQDLKSNRCAQTIDHSALKKSHFTLGDTAQAPKDLYDSVYSKTMLHYKEYNRPHTTKQSNSQTNIMITGDKSVNYQTEFKSK